MSASEDVRSGQADRPEIERVWHVLRQVVDPEPGVNIVDLGLVYNVELRDDRVHAAMTVTTPACPMKELLTTMVRTAILQQIPTAQSVEVELVWGPPWQPEMMSDAAKSQLGWNKA
ncbi:MAG: metal-sulfur cluster assembly factor [Nitrospirae bacterium]|nr:metal-sulfur cluster assembly factor [Nitrospirota bacterium]